MNDVRNAIVAFWRYSRIGLCAGFVLAVVPAGSAGAQTGGGALRDACRADYQKFCASVQRGNGRIRQCMLENAEQLTPQCKEALKARQGTNQQ